MPRGRLVIVSAPSGAGKTSLAKALVASLDDTVLSVSHTTRPRRESEIDGVDYYFVDKAQFQRMVRADAFLEYAMVFQNYYGTSRDEVERQLSRGANVLLDIDWQGARKVREKMHDVYSVFVVTPSMDELEKRLRSRAQDTEAVIAHRMREAAEEMRHYEEYDYLVVNDDFDLALADLRAIVTGRDRERRSTNKELVQMLLQDAESRMTSKHMSF